MWESNAKSAKPRKFGILSDLANVIAAVAGTHFFFI